MIGPSPSDPFRGGSVGPPLSAPNPYVGHRFMDVDRWIPQPVAIKVDGRDVRLGEITLEAQARLQAWIRANVPHPVAAVKHHLDGLSPEDRAVVLSTAAREAPHWPPKVGTPEGARALLGDARGQALVMLEGLRAADPAATPEQAEWLARRLNRTRGAKLSGRVLSIIFGTDLDDPEADPETDGDSEASGPKGGDAGGTSDTVRFPST